MTANQRVYYRFNHQITQSKPDTRPLDHAFRDPNILGFSIYSNMALYKKLLSLKKLLRRLVFSATVKKRAPVLWNRSDRILGPNRIGTDPEPGRPVPVFRPRILKEPDWIGTGSGYLTLTAEPGRIGTGSGFWQNRLLATSSFLTCFKVLYVAIGADLMQCI